MINHKLQVRSRAENISKDKVEIYSKLTKFNKHSKKEKVSQSLSTIQIDKQIQCSQFMRLSRESKRSLKRLISNTPSSFAKFRNPNLISINLESKKPASILGGKRKSSKGQVQSPPSFEFDPDQKVRIFLKDPFNFKGRKDLDT